MYSAEFKKRLPFIFLLFFVTFFNYKTLGSVMAEVGGTIGGPSTVVQGETANFSGVFWEYSQQRLRVARCVYVSGLGDCSDKTKYQQISGCSYPPDGGYFPYISNYIEPYPPNKDYNCSWITSSLGTHTIALKSQSAVGNFEATTTILVVSPAPTVTPTGSPSPTPPDLTPTLSPTPTPCSNEQISFSGIPALRYVETTGGIDITATINNAANSRQYCMKFHTPINTSDTIAPCVDYSGVSGGSLQFTRTYGDPNEIGFHRIYIHSNSCASELGGQDFEVRAQITSTPTPTSAVPVTPTPTPNTNFSAVTSITETAPLGYCVLHYTSTLTKLAGDTGIVPGAPGYFQNTSGTPSWCISSPPTINLYGSNYQIRCDVTFNSPPLSCGQVPDTYRAGVCTYINGTKQKNSCAGVDTGPHDPFLTSLRIVPDSCDYYGDPPIYKCQVEATSDGGAGTSNYRFSASVNDSPVQIAQNTAATTSRTILEGSFSNGINTLFSPDADCGSSCRLDSVDLEMQTLLGDNSGCNYHPAWSPPSWDTYFAGVNIRMAEYSGNWSWVEIPLSGNGQYAETGNVELNVFNHDSCDYNGTLHFSFLGSRPILRQGHTYRIFAYANAGQRGGEAPYWSRNASGFKFRVYAKPQFNTGGTFEGANPYIPPWCSGSSNYCSVWWTPPQSSGDYKITADLLIDNDIVRDYELDHVVTGYAATGKSITQAISLPEDPWYQTIGGDVHAFGSINAEIPAGLATNDEFSLDKDGFPGVVSFLSGGANFGGHSASSKNWLAMDSYYPSVNYESLATLLGVDETTPTITCGLSGCPSNISAGTHVYIARDTDLQITSQPWEILPGRKIVVFVENNLEISKEVKVNLDPNNPAFLAFIVQGNIYINGALGSKTTLGSDGQPWGATNAHLQGIYYTDGFIDTFSNRPPGDGTGSGNRLVVAGSFIAGSGMTLPRDLKDGGGPISNNTEPAELFIFRPDLVVNAPVSLFPKSMSWQEIAP